MRPLCGVLYNDGSARMPVEKSRLEVPPHLVPILISNGVELAPTHMHAPIPTGRTVLETRELVAVALQPEKRPKRVLSKEKKPTRVSILILMDSAGNRIEVHNLASWVRIEFPSEYSRAYYAFLRRRSYKQYRIISKDTVVLKDHNTL